MYRSPTPAGTGTKRWLFLALCLFATLSFFALGVWQVERRTWKLALIAAVDKRVQAPPAVPPSPPRWGSVNAADDAYRHVIVRGQFLVDHDTLVQALTERGPGFWIMSPLKTDQGFIVLINRGFVPAEWHAKTSGRPHGRTSITGLLRLTEPGGSFLQANQPLAGRWHSRDVAAIARARGLNRVAPYFIDADTAPNPGGWPKGGLTVISFPNNHLAYAFTWFALAALSLFGSVAMVRRGAGFDVAPSKRSCCR